MGAPTIRRWSLCLLSGLNRHSFSTLMATAIDNTIFSTFQNMIYIFVIVKAYHGNKDVGVGQSLLEQLTVEWSLCAIQTSSNRLL